jgi:dTDP-4-amino-4,6-dideoxygalactose transaminase
MAAGEDISIASLRFGEDEERLVLEVLRSGWLAQGPKVERLEELFAEAAGTGYAVAVNSGTAALIAALKVLDLEPGDEVITSPLTFAATLNAIVAAGGVARFVDVTDDMTIDPDAVAAGIGRRTKVLLPVHLYGLPAAMDRLEQLGSRQGLAIVEDAAQAVGARIAERQVGSFGQGCFSLYATKNVTTGEGGVVATSDAGLAEELRLLRNQGMRRRDEYERIGDNLRMTELQAAVGIPQMERLGEINHRRRENAARLTEGLGDVPGLSVPVVPSGRTHVFHQYTVLVGDNARLDRDALAAGLNQAGIATAVHYPRVVFDYQCYADHPQVVPEPVPRAREAVRRVLSLPVHPHLTGPDLDRVIGAVRHLLGA